VSNSRYYVTAPTALGMGITIVLGAALTKFLYLPEKWEVAVIMTVVPFWYTADLLVDRIARMSFWIPFGALLLVHLLLLWVVLGLILSGIRTFPLAFAIPVVMIEALFVFMIMDGMERKLHKRAKKAKKAQYYR
jgi:hypothetical protein